MCAWLLTAATLGRPSTRYVCYALSRGLLPLNLVHIVKLDVHQISWIDL